METIHAGHRFLRFHVRAEGSSSEAQPFSYCVVTSRISLREKLAAGADIYVVGHLTISAERLRTATIQALAIQMMEPARKSADELSMEMFADGIPLQSI